MRAQQRLRELIPDLSIFIPASGGFRRELMCIASRRPIGTTPEYFVHNGRPIPNFVLAGDSVFVSNAELDEIHPKLAQGIELLDIKQLATGARIRRMLAVWLAAAHVVTMDKKLVALYDITSVHILSGRVRVESSKVECEPVLNHKTGDTLLMPTGHLHSPFVDISAAWLDTEYPGWRERFEGAKLLDMGLDLAMQSMLMPGLVNQDVVVPPDLSM